MASTDKTLKSSSNYIWNTTAVLGKGATSCVYQGMNKHTGEVVAIKSFNYVSHMRPTDVQRREYDVLSKVNHENIVKLLAIEEENEKQHKILVMELCTGGSLFNILDDPVNSFGLEETEFLLVLNHLTAGMKYLRDINIIHRDLKPGNIMKFITDDGQTIYKLTDFGAARELEEDQQFVSLYGTEEYLHPEMYAKAVLKKPAVKSFSAKVDLWSIGVTLFHIATGSLPFRPYGGRKNREMMHRITTEKQPGIISGIQHSDSGEIEWHSNLPKTCLLSPSLQQKVTPLLAGLLEYNHKNMWTFEQFFQATTHVLNHTAVHVFCVSNICLYTFYMSPNDKIFHLKTKLAGEDSACIHVSSQLMIYNERQLNDDEPIVSTQLSQPIILLNNKATSIKANTNLISPNQFKFPDILNTVVTNAGEHGAQQGKACASIAYCIQRTSARCLLYCNVINRVPLNVMSLIETNVRMLNEKRDFSSHLMESLRDLIEYTSETTFNLCKCINKLDASSSLKASVEINEIRAQFIEDLEKNWKELAPKIMDINRRMEGLAGRWQPYQAIYLQRISASKARADTYCGSIKDSWLYLHKNKSTIVMAGTESQYQHLEKLRIDANCKKLTRLLYDDTSQANNELVEKLDDWYNDAHVALVQSECLIDELGILIKSRDRILDELNNAIESQHMQWQFLMNHLTTAQQQQQQANINHPSHEVASGTLADATNGAGGISTAKPPLPSDQVTDNPAAELTAAAAMAMDDQQLRQLVKASGGLGGLDCSHGNENLLEEIQHLKEAQRRLCESLSENQNLFSELVSITISAKANPADLDQC